MLPATHRDTDNFHMHIAVNPINYKATNIWKDYDILQQYLRTLDRK
ncbi:relaxase/mobilization nuclease domain-containing protein [Photorhabdus australis]